MCGPKLLTNEMRGKEKQLLSTKAFFDVVLSTAKSHHIRTMTEEVALEKELGSVTQLETGQINEIVNSLGEIVADDIILVTWFRSKSSIWILTLQ